jgi:nitroreductase
MAYAIPDREAIDIAFGWAVRAPSVHNTQPWRWRTTPTGIELFADTRRQLAVTDPSQRSLVVSCGAALHHLRVALSVLGWATTVEYLPDHSAPDHLATVRTTRQHPSELQIKQAAAILMRHTDRRHYSTRPVSTRHIRFLATQVGSFGAVSRQVPIRMLPLLATPMRRAAGLHATDRHYQDELAAWSGRNRIADGVPSRNAPAARPADEIPVRTFAEPALADPTDQPDGAQWLVLGTPRDDRRAHLRAGEALSALLLTATSLGMATSLQTEPLGMADTRQEIRSGLLHDCAYPQALIRVGWNTRNSAPLSAAPRRPVEEILHA